MRKNLYRCACITGASQGLGLAFARECAARGMSLFLVALPESGLPEVSDELTRRYGVPVEWLEADLTDLSTPDRMLRFIRANGLPIDLLINNAGISSVGLFRDAELEHHEYVIELNVKSLMRLTYLLVPELKERSAACILNVASLSAVYPIHYLPVYSATKSFVLSFSAALRNELEGEVGVSVLCPNTIRTPGAVQEFIDRQGPLCRLACLYPERIAREAVEGAVRNRPVIVPGRLNRLIHGIAPAVPGRLVAMVARRYWGEFDTISRAARPVPEPAAVHR